MFPDKVALSENRASPIPMDYHHVKNSNIAMLGVPGDQNCATRKEKIYSRVMKCRQKYIG